MAHFSNSVGQVGSEQQKVNEKGVVLIPRRTSTPGAMKRCDENHYIPIREKAVLRALLLVPAGSPPIDTQRGWNEKAGSQTGRK
jgi:hypothetical protein